MIKRELGDIVAIESETFLTVVDAEKGTHMMTDVKFSNIAKSFKYAGEEFKLKGVVELLQEKDHFIVHVNRNGIWKTYDDLKHVRHARDIKIDRMLKPAMLLYVRNYSYKCDPPKPVPANINLSTVPVGKLITIILINTIIWCKYQSKIILHSKTLCVKVTLLAQNLR